MRALLPEPLKALSGGSEVFQRPTRIVVADAHPVFRYGLQGLLSAHSDLLVVGEAATGAETLLLAEQLQPDLVLLDLHLADGSGRETLRRLRHYPGLRVLVMAIDVDRHDIPDLLTVGARGVVRKDAPTTLLAKSIRAVLAG